MSALESRALNVRPSIELLRGLKPHEADLILTSARTRRVPAKSVMTYQGEPADQLLLLWKGRARYFFETPNGKKLILMWITPGQSGAGTTAFHVPPQHGSSPRQCRASLGRPDHSWPDPQILPTLGKCNHQRC
jgi:hypothetical protein